MFKIKFYKDLMLGIEKLTFGDRKVYNSLTNF